jgi:thymidylate synthase (FAD)
MEIKLISWTNDPLKTIFLAFMNMHNDVPVCIEELEVSEEELEDFFGMLVMQPHQTVFEYVNTNWVMKGVSRAFQQQLTRTRLASYSNQSLRIVGAGDFAEKKKYLRPSGVLAIPEAAIEYDRIMFEIQKSYNKLVSLGCKTEDARGVLPLNVHSPVTQSINLHSLYNMLGLRFCDNTQEEYREVAKLMKKEIGEKIHPILAEPIQPLCFRLGYCPSPVYCGEYPGMEQKIKMDVSRWIKG